MSNYSGSGANSAATNDKGHREVPLILWAWQLVIAYQVQLGCYPESRMPLSGTPLSLGVGGKKSTLVNRIASIPPSRSRSRWLRSTGQGQQAKR